jgi:hypothetical protein
MEIDEGRGGAPEVHSTIWCWMQRWNVSSNVPAAADWWKVLKNRRTCPAAATHKRLSWCVPKARYGYTGSSVEAQLRSNRE